MDHAVSSPGPRLPFREWSRRLVYAVRRKLPEPVVVKAPEDGTVTIRLGARVATITNDEPARAVSLADDARRARAETLTDERGDAEAAEELADSVVTYLSSRR